MKNAITAISIALCIVAIGLQGGCVSGTIAGYIREMDSNTSAAANVATSRSAAQAVPGSSNTTSAVEGMQGGGTVSAEVPEQ